METKTTQTGTKIGVVVYLLAFLSADLAFARALMLGELPTWLQSWVQIDKLELAVKCILTGGAGGILYTLRAVYLSSCVRNDWNSRWITWYFIRPITSSIAGWIAWLFAEAGLLILDAEAKTNAGQLGFLALALIAGLNVDKFLSKIEDVARSIWGIESSRAAKNSQEDQK